MKKKSLYRTLILAVSASALTACQKGADLPEPVEELWNKVEEALPGKKDGENKGGGWNPFGKKEKEETEEDSQETEEEEEERPQLELELEEKQLSEWNGEVTLCQARYDLVRMEEEGYPELYQALEKLNQENEEAMSSWYQECLEAAKEAYTGGYFYGYDASRSLQVRRADTEVLSLLQYSDEYTGGAHGMYWNEGKNFDVNTGEEIALEQVVTDPSRLPDLITQKLLERYSREAFFEGYEDVVRSQFEPEDPNHVEPSWVLDYNGITFYYDPYELGPYASGMQEVMLAFDEYPDLFSGKYSGIGEEYAVSIGMYNTVFVDLNRDKVPEAVCVGAYESSGDGYYGYQLDINVDDQNYSFFLSESCGISDCYLMKLEDDRVYLYVENMEVDDITRIEVYELTGGGVNTGGDYLGSFLSDQIVRPDCFRLVSHLDALSTYSGYKNYHIGYDGLPEPDDRLYTILSDVGEGYSVGHHLTAKRPVSVWMIDEDETVASEPEELPAGTVFYFRRTDNRSLVEMELEDGRRCQVRYDSSGWPRTINGVSEEECFEGVMYAG